MTRGATLVLMLTICAGSAQAVECSQTTFNDADYTICEVDAAREQLELFLRDDEDEILGQFSAVDRFMERRGLRLSFAMNAGMYHDDRAPVGYYLEDGEESMRVVSNAGPGNFGLLPNGIFCIRNGRADVIETLAFLDAAPECIDATQSGPMLVIDGELHPRFLKDGTSVYIRNGVGTSSDGQRVVFAISDEPVNFYSFGLLFRDYLNLPNALFFDGNISRLYAPQLSRSDFGFSLGPIVGVVEQIQP